MDDDGKGRRGRKPGPGPHQPRHERAKRGRTQAEEERAQAPSNRLDLADKLRALLDDRKLSQSRLTERVYDAISRGTAPPGAKSIHQTRISKWLLRSGEPSLTQALQLAEALDVPFDYFANARRVEPPDFDRLRIERQVYDLIEALGVEQARDRLLLAGPILRVAEVDVPRDQTEAGSKDRDRRRDGT